VAFVDEVADGKRITGGRTRREALVRHVEEGEEFLVLDDIGNLLPLRRSGVDACRVVRARMKKNNASFGGVLCFCESHALTAQSQHASATHLQVLLQASKVQTNCLLVKVTVVANLETRVTEDRSVVTP
jgi:hypothetical protein